MNKFSILNRLRPNNNIQPQELDGPVDPEAQEFSPEMNEAQQDASRAYAEQAQAMNDVNRNLNELPIEAAAPVNQEQIPQPRAMTPQETAAELNKDSGVKQLSEEELKQEQYIRDLIQRSMR